MPRNIFVGRFENNQYDSSAEVKNDLNRQLNDIFEKCEVEGTYFIFVGNNWSWKKGSVRIDDEE